MSEIEVFSPYGNPRQQAKRAADRPLFAADDTPHGLTPRQIAAMEARMEQMLPGMVGQYGQVNDILGDILPKGANLAPGAGAGYRNAVRRTGSLGPGNVGLQSGGTFQTQQRPYQPEFECVLPATPVMLPGGRVKLFKDIEAGDRIVGSDGRAHTVERHWNSGTPDELVEVKLWGGETFTTTINHKWPVFAWARTCHCGCGEPVKPGRIYKLQAADLQPGDFMLVPRRFDSVKVDVTPSKARLLGYYVAEGSIDWGVDLTFGHHERDTWVKDAEALLAHEGVEFATDEMPNHGVTRVRTRFGYARQAGVSLKRWVQDHAGVGSTATVLSAEVMHWPLDLKQQLITGMFRGDGSTKGPKGGRSFTVTYTTASETLARQTVLILAQLGFPARIVEVKEPRNASGLHYRVDVKGGQYPRDLADMVWGDASRAREYTRGNDVTHACMVDDDYIYVPIEDVTIRPNVEQTEVFNVTVSAADSNYCIGSRIPVLTSNSPDRQQYPVHRILANRSWRLFYKLDPVIGIGIDMFGDLPWGNVEFTGDGVDGEVKDLMEYSWDECEMRTRLPEATREYFVVGEAAPHLFFDDSVGCWTYCALHNPDQLEVIDAPFVKMDPVVEFVPDQRLQQVLNSNHAMLRQVRESMPPELLVRLMSRQNIPLSPVNFTFLPRKLHPYDTRGTSIISRMWRILMYEDAIYNASIATARRHAGPLKVAKLGNPQTGWIPGPEHERKLQELLANAELDPVAWLVYHHGINFEMVGTTERVMSIDKHNEIIERVKLIALGISKAFLHGEVTYASAESGLTVFLQRLKALRQFFESKWLLPKFFFQMAKINKWVKPTEAELSNRVRVRRSHREVAEDARYIMPDLQWDRSLDPTVDSEMISAIDSLSNLGVEFSKSTMFALAGKDFEDETKQRVRDWEFEKRTVPPEMMAAAAPDGPGGGGGLGGGGMIPGIPGDTFGDDLGGEPGGDLGPELDLGDGGDEPPTPEGAGYHADDGNDDQGPDPFRDTDRVNVWTEAEVRDLLGFLKGDEPEDEPWIDALKDRTVRDAWNGGNTYPEELWEAIEDWMADEQFPVSQVKALVDILKRKKVLPSSAVRARHDIEHLMGMIDDSDGGGFVPHTGPRYARTMKAHGQGRISQDRRGRGRVSRRRSTSGRT